MTNEQAVALAQDHNAEIYKHPDLPFKWVRFTDAKLTSMLTDHEQQVIQRLAEQSGVMPKTWIGQLYFCNKCGYTGLASSHDGCNYAAAEAPRYTETMVREALAKMQARVYWLERHKEMLLDAREHAWTVAKNLQARVEQLERALQTLDADGEWHGDGWIVPAANWRKAKAALKGASNEA